MISVDLPSRMQCEEPECTRAAPVELLLTGGGAFVFKPREEGWQVVLPSGPVGLGSPFRTRCPEHHQTIEKPPPSLQLPRGVQVGPSGPRVRR